jgi:hypothetical protein
MTSTSSVQIQECVRLSLSLFRSSAACLDKTIVVQASSSHDMIIMISHRTRTCHVHANDLVLGAQLPDAVLLAAFEGTPVFGKALVTPLVR